MRNRNKEGRELQATLTLSPEADSEERLIEAARAGDADVWRELYHRYFHKMYTYAYSRIGDSAAAEDIAAEVFLGAWKGRKSLQYRGVPISAWLYRIAHNLSADFLRRRNRIRFEPLDSGRSEAELKSSGHEDDIATRQEIVAAVRRLTPEQQQVVVMRLVENMSMAGVAAAIGKSEGAVKALQHRALRSLRQRLDGSRNREEV